MADPRMTLIVDDSIDVWSDDLRNLCLTRRFVGDKLDDGLQLLSWQLDTAYRAFYEDAPAGGCYTHWEASPASAGAPPPCVPRTMMDVVRGQRGHLLSGCVIALTGVIADQSEVPLERQPLVVLIRTYGGEVTPNVDAATHLVARRKDGWHKSPKINRALGRVQVAPAPPCRACCWRATAAVTCTAAAAAPPPLLLPGTHHVPNPRPRRRRSRPSRSKAHALICPRRGSSARPSQFSCSARSAGAAHLFCRNQHTPRSKA